MIFCFNIYNKLMPTIERFGQQQRDAEKKEPEGPTLNEILAHPEENVLFGKYLKQSDGGDNILLLAGEAAKRFEKCHQPYHV